MSKGTPFVTSWMGETGFATWPVVAYGVVVLLSAVAYSILVRVLIARHGKESALAVAVGDDRKGNLSLLLYAAALPTAFLDPRLSCAMYALVALIWLVPDPRIERALKEKGS